MNRLALISAALGLVFAVGAVVYLSGESFSLHYQNLKEFQQALIKKGNKVVVQSPVAPFALNIYKAKEGLILNIDGRVNSCFLFNDKMAWSSMEESQKNIHNQFKSQAKKKATIKTFNNVRCFLQ